MADGNSGVYLFRNGISGQQVVKLNSIQRIHAGLGEFCEPVISRSMKQTLATLLLFLFLAPMAIQAQEVDRIQPPTGYIPVPAEPADIELRERHYTLELLDSDSGEAVLQHYRELMADGYYEAAAGRMRLMNTVGDTTRFWVRNPDESSGSNTVFDHVLFQLTRSGPNLEIWVEVDELGPDRISEEVMDEWMRGLLEETPSNSTDPDRGIIDIVLEIFGDLPNVDGEETLRILVTDVNDGWEGEEGQTFIAGFFDPINMLPTEEHENSNMADIIYINSNPGVYRQGLGVVNPRLNTMAHELQHLIHAGYGGNVGNLILFQNEGQSELAEIITGYPARPMNFLNLYSEMSGDQLDGPDHWIYRFRRGDPEVLFDYQRAGLIHSYMAGRVGIEETGALTRMSDEEMTNGLPGDAAYRNLLDGAGIALGDFFTDFYTAAYSSRMVAAENRFGFTFPQLAGTRVSNPGRIYTLGVQPWVSGQQQVIYYGGAHYTQWFGVEDLWLDIRDTEGIRHHLLYRMLGEEDYGLIEVDETGGEFVLDAPGVYEEIVLVSVNVDPGDLSDFPPDNNRTFTYSGEWSVTDLATQELAYHGSPVAKLVLGDNALAVALRISPEFDAAVQYVRFNINNHEGAVQGSGELALRLREAVPGMDNPDNPLYRPGTLIASQPFSLNDISSGENFLGVESEEWPVLAGEEYFIAIEVVEDLGGLLVEFLLDAGSADEEDSNYYPVRTFVGIENNVISWRFFEETRDEQGEIIIYNHPNLLMAAHVVGFSEDAVPPGFPDPPVSEAFELTQNFPNPFRGDTTIEFNVPESAQVEITLHDVLGRKVAELFSGMASAGYHSLSFDAGRLAGGIYFYRMRSPGGVESKQMTLVR